MSDNRSKDSRTRTQLFEEIEQLQLRLDEAEQTLEAIRNGDVDALVVTGPQGEQVFTLTGAEHIYRVIVETMNEAALVVDPDGTILFCNQRFCELLKAPIQEVMGRKAATFVARPQQPPLKTLLADARTGPVQRRLTLQATDGTSVPVQLSVSPLPADGAVSVCLVATDLTELEASANSIRVLREQQQALEESEERFRTLADNISQLAWMTDESGWIFWYNKRWYEYTGTTFREMEGWGWQKVHHPDHVEQVTEEFRRHVQTGEIWEDTFPLRGKDGQYRWFLSRAIPVRDESGKVVRWFGTNTDITERRKMEEAMRELTGALEVKVAERTAELQYRARQLQKLALDLSQAEDSERRRLAEILHDDLQQMLAAAKFHLNLLVSRAKRDPAQQAIIGEVEHLLVEAIGKSRSLSHELSPAVLYHDDFGGALGWLAGQVQSKHGLEVAVETFGEVRVESDAIKSFLYKAAQELLFNAVKHARVNQARIRVRRLGRCICLSVSDQGRGFDPQELRQTAGFGLLSIRERIELLGGRMKIHSLKGKGSTFHIVVPDCPQVEGGYPGAPADGKGMAGGRVHPTAATSGRYGGKEGYRGGLPLRVLLADDHQIVREGLMSLLGDEHDILVVGEAANGREAVNETYRLQPDVVIMDVAMPLINGDDATRQIKLHLPKTRVIALSMYEGPELEEKMRRAGAESYILKTAPANELLAAIRGKKRLE